MQGKNWINPEIHVVNDRSTDGAAPDQIDQIKQEIGEEKLNAVVYTCISERADEFLQHGHRTLYAVDLKKRIEKQENLFLLDIRLSENFADGHIPGSVNIEFIEVMEPNSLALLPRDGTPIILICYTGHTASQVNSILNLLGYNAWILRFGMMSWNALTLTGLWSSRHQQEVIGGGFHVETVPETWDQNR
jgi:rhodanese-related sulfurtransferase